MSRDQQIVNATMAKFFDRILATDLLMGSPDAGRRFVSFASPGIPITVNDLSFGAASTPYEVEAAAAFAELVNTIPVTEGNWLNSGEKLWNRYRRILEEAQLPLSALNSTEQQQLTNATSAVWDGTGETERFKRYSLLADAYYAAKLAYNSRLVAVRNNPDDQALHQAWRAEETILQMEINRIYQEWVAAGKHEIEKALTIIETLSQRDPFIIWSKYKEQFRLGQYSDTTGQIYYPTTYSATNRFDELTWTAFSVQENEIVSIDQSNKHLWGGGVQSDYKLWQFGNASSLINAQPTITQRSRAEKCQVRLKYKRLPLRRTWIDTAIFNSRLWRWKDSSSELLSDGMMPPSGVLTAYPTEIIVIKDLEIKINLSSGDDVNAVGLFDKFDAIAWGLFRLRGKPLLHETRPEIASLVAPNPMPIDLSAIINQFPRTPFETPTTITPSIISGIDLGNISLDPDRLRPTSSDILFDPSLLGKPEIPSHSFGDIERPFLGRDAQARATFNNSLSDINRLLRRADQFERKLPIQPHDFVASSHRIVVPGMQIIGFVCKLLPRTPFPDLRLTWE